MSKQKSINQRLRRAKSPEVKREIVTDWSANWRCEQLELIVRLAQAIVQDDHDDLCIATGQLKKLTEKRFAAMPEILINLTGETK